MSKKSIRFDLDKRSVTTIYYNAFDTALLKIDVGYQSNNTPAASPDPRVRVRSWDFENQTSDEQDIDDSGTAKQMKGHYFTAEVLKSDVENCFVMVTLEEYNPKETS